MGSNLFWIEAIRYDLDNLSSLKFNPLISDSLKNSLNISKNLDPDSNFFPQSIDFEYYLEGSFCNMLAENSNRLDSNDR